MLGGGVAFAPVGGGAVRKLAPRQARFSEVGRLPAGLLAYRGAVEELDELIHQESKLHADTPDAHRETPLHIAATYGQLDVVKFLVRDAQATVDAPNWEGWTPFFCAVSRGNVEIADFLLRAGANLHHTTPSGMYAMHIAAWFAQDDSVAYLLTKRAHLHKENVYGNQPIAMARPGPIKRVMYKAQEELDDE